MTAVPNGVTQPVTNPFFERFGCDKTPVITQVASITLGPTTGGTEVRMGARFFDSEGWKKMKGYRLACEFGFQEYRNGAWEGTYLLTPVQVLHSNKWYPAETYDGYETAAGVPSASVFTAAACAFEVIGTRQTTYQCLRCFTPPSPFQVLFVVGFCFRSHCGVCFW